MFEGGQPTTIRQRYGGVSLLILFRQFSLLASECNFFVSPWGKAVSFCVEDGAFRFQWLCCRPNASSSMLQRD
jgi:hypothetical protein